MAITHTHDSSTTRSTNGLNTVDWIAMVLLIIGGLNWALVGLADFDLVAAIFGEGSGPSRLVYVLVGLAALWCIYTATRLGSRNRDVTA